MLESPKDDAWNTAIIQKLLITPNAIVDSMVLGRKQSIHCIWRREVSNDILEESCHRVVVGESTICLQNVKLQLQCGNSNNYRNNNQH